MHAPHLHVQVLSRVRKAIGSPFRGDYIRMNTCEEPGVTKDRIGTPHQLHLKKTAFTTVLSTPCRFVGGPGALEAGALVLLLRWIGRSWQKQGHRVVVLVDAKAVLGAAAKGRTSAPSFKVQIRKLSALTLASDLLVLYIYIPSEDYTADEPSRGVVSPRRCAHL